MCARPRRPAPWESPCSGPEGDPGLPVDLNCDLGEGAGDDAAILPFVTSANVACAMHAGTPTTMWRTVEEAAARGVAVGAHPGFADRAGFGRQVQELTAAEVRDLVAYQVAALAAFARRAGVVVQHVKAHGGLYHLAARRPDIAGALAAAVAETAPGAIVVGPPASATEAAARRLGLRFAGEGFLDRAYERDGTLTPRDRPGALLDDDDEALAARAVAMIRDGRVRAAGGALVPLSVQTLCLHGDDPRAPARAAAVRAALERAGIAVAPLGAWLR